MPQKVLVVMFSFFFLGKTESIRKETERAEKILEKNNNRCMTNQKEHI